MMSVLTILLLVVTCLSILTDGAPNKKDHESFQSPISLRPRDILPNSVKDTHYPGLNASGSSRVPPRNKPVAGKGYFPMPSGTVKSDSSFGSSSIASYPTEGAPYQNSTSLYPKLGNGEGENGQSGRGNQCPPQQTVTLPPQTITLPAQTATMTLAPETITITQTSTVTVTAQTQTTTVTVWMTVTANQVPSCSSPGNAASPQSPPAPSPIAQPSNTPFVPVSDNASTPVVIPPIVTTTSTTIPPSAGNAVPIANTTSPATPNLGPNTATGPTTSTGSNQVVSVAQQPSSSSIASSVSKYTPNIAPYPYRNTTNQTLPFGSGSSRGFRPTGSGTATPTNIHLSSFFVSKYVTETPFSTTTIGPSPTIEYFLGNGSSLSVPPSQAHATVFQPTDRVTAPPFPTREYFPGNISSLMTLPAQANTTTSPTPEYFPNDGSSLLTPPAQANVTSVPLISGTPAPVNALTIVGSSQTLAAVLGSATPLRPPQIIQSNTSTSILPLSTPITPPRPPILQSNTSSAQPASTSSSDPSEPATTSASPFCTNGTTAQNITENVRPSLPPILFLLIRNPINTPNPLVLRNPNHTLLPPHPPRP